MEGTSRVGVFRNHTDNTYNVYRKKFSDFVGYEFDGSKTLPSICYTDDNVAAFIAKIGVDSDHKVCLLE
jgi:hypothetical protein